MDGVWAAAQRQRTYKHVVPTDPIEYIEKEFYVPITGKPAVLMPHQKATLKLALTRNEHGDLPFRHIIYSTIKQSGKSTVSGMITRWYAESQRPNSELYFIGNDLDQAKTRGFREIRYSLETTPGYDRGRDILPGRWTVQKTTMRCLTTGSEIRALPVDPKGEAGGKPAIQSWTETWGITDEAGLRFWAELTPIPTIPDSMRITETYAGYLNESSLLHEQYELGLQGTQLTGGDIVRLTGMPLGTFHEALHADDPVPIWVNDNAGVMMYWDTGLAARRMPWQQGERGLAYYREQELTLHPSHFRRLHFNEWVSSEAAFVLPSQYDACRDDTIPPLLDGDRTPLVIAVDAATSNDCFGIVAVSRHPTRHEEVCLRASRVWVPKDKGGHIEYAEPEAFLRELCSKYNVVQIAYDPYQLEAMMQRLTTDEVAWCHEFFQGKERLEADRGLYDGIITRTFWHNGDPDVRQHMLNAGAKLSPEDSTMRLVKRQQTMKIDLAVATSMARARAKWLNI